MKALIIISIFTFFSLNTFAQTAESIATGRPGQAIGPRVVGTGLFQIQSGLDMNTLESTGQKTTLSTVNNILRLGLSEDFEISSIVDYRENKLQQGGMETSNSGISQFQLGFRYNIIPKSAGWIPAIGFQTRFKMKFTSHHFPQNQVSPVMILAMNHSLGNGVALTTNGIMSYSGNSAVPLYGYVLSLSKSLGSRWTVVAEAYGNENNDVDSNYLGLGAGYIVNSDFQLDAYLSSGDNNGVEELYGTVGISWRCQVF